MDRMPFGALPPNFGEVPAEVPTVTDAQLQAQQQKLAQQINMSAINVQPDGSTAIGFTDLAAKPPVNFYLPVGSAAGGWTVVKADYDDEWAQIEKEGVTITLKLGKGLIEAPPEPTRAAAAPALAPGRPTLMPPVPATAHDPSLPPGLIRRPSQAGQPAVPGLTPATQIAEMQKMREDLSKLKESGGDIKSYMERLRERKAQENVAKAAAEESARAKLQELASKMTQEELAKKEREINLSLIEQGAKPISEIQLTPEEEQALVDKGVLAQ
jgi:hypothetical protein